jgi:HD-like signal output (HDOD) protein
MNQAQIEKLIATDAQVRTPFSGLPLLLRKLSDDEVGFDELVATLQRFPSVTARLLAVANSAWCSPRGPVASLQSACTQLGLALIRSISISVAVSAPFDTRRCPLFDPAVFWYSSLLVADTAERLAAQCKNAAGIERGAVHTAGLLHNVGLLWLADKLPDYVTRACQKAEAEPTASLNDALRAVLGAGIGEVSSLLLEVWGLPSLLAVAIRYRSDSEYAGDGWQAAALVGGATVMVSALRRSADLAAAIPALDRLGIATGSRRATYEKIKAKSSQVRAAAEALARV